MTFPRSRWSRLVGVVSTVGGGLALLALLGAYQSLLDHLIAWTRPGTMGEELLLGGSWFAVAALALFLLVLGIRKMGRARTGRLILARTRMLIAATLLGAVVGEVSGSGRGSDDAAMGAVLGAVVAVAVWLLSGRTLREATGGDDSGDV